MAVGGARVALACLLLIALGVPVEADPVAPAATPSADIRTARWEVVSDAALPSTDLVDLQPITLLRGEPGDDLNCIHVLEGVPGTAPGPVQTLCLRSDGTPFPLGDGAVRLDPAALGPLVNGSNPAADLRLDVVLEFTYDCGHIGDAHTVIAGGLVQEHAPLPGEALGAVVHAASYPAVLEVVAKDETGPLTVSRTTVPGAGDFIAYVFLESGSQGGGSSDLCS